MRNITSAETNSLTLVTAGASEYTIVRREAAGADEILASEEMQKYLCQITGVTLPIVTDSTPAGACEIVIGQTNREAEGQFDRAELTRDGFIIKTDGGKLWLVGGSESGALFAVYEFLEGWLGCRFFANDCEKIPRLETVLIPQREDKQIPALDIRYHNWFVCQGPIFRKLKMRTPRWAGSGCHTLPELAEVGGGCDPDPCLQSEEVFQTVLKNVRALLAKNPDAEFVSVSQTDPSGAEQNNYCKCDACRAYEEKNGASANYLQFVNRIADAIREEYPRVKIHSFAYKRSLDAPLSDIKAADNVVVQICTHDNCFSHPLSECAAGVVSRKQQGPDVPIGKIIRDWSKVCKYLCIWDYTTNFSTPILTFPNLDVLWQNISFFAAHNSKYIFEQGTHDPTPSGSFGELKAYLLGRLLWDPYMGKERYYAYMDEFMEEYYGPGWKSIRAYIDYTETVSEAFHFNWFMCPGEMLQYTCDAGVWDRSIPVISAEDLRNYRNVDWSQYYEYFPVVSFNDVAERGQAWYAEAEKACQTEEQRFRVRRSSTQADMFQVFCMEAKAVRQYAPGAEKIFDGNLQVYIADGTFSPAEAEELKADFDREILEPIRHSFVPYQREVAQKLIDHGVTTLRMGIPTCMYLTGEFTFWSEINAP